MRGLELNLGVIFHLTIWAKPERNGSPRLKPQHLNISQTPHFCDLDKPGRRGVEIGSNAIWRAGPELVAWLAD